MKLYTTGQAAAKIGRHKSSVQRAASRLGIGTATPLGLVLSDADLSRIAAEIKPIGCPKMVAGNDLWRLRKKPKKRAKSSR